MRTPSPRLFLSPSLMTGLILSLTAHAQSLPPANTPSPAPAPQEAPEMSTKEAPALFKARVNLVLVPVVVRDAKGRALGTFTKENFLLFDKGRPQEITKFSVEKSGAKAAREAQTLDAPPAAAGEPAALPDVPERFVAYVFDDAHLQFGDLARARDAAGRQLTGMTKTDRAAIYTTSGQDQIDFTDDQEKLHEALLRLRARSYANPGATPACPEISYYMADMIANKGDTAALNAAALESAICTMGPAAAITPAQIAAFEAAVAAAKAPIQQQARQIVSVESQQTRVALSVLKDVVRHMSAMPGERIVVLISPGFITPEEQEDKNEVLDRAIRANVLINSLDARGLWTDPAQDANRSGGTITNGFAQLKQQYDHLSVTAQAGVLMEMAAGTGGTVFQNSNDLDAGLRQLVTAPEYYYVLGFSPQNLKLDGSFHSLKVTFKSPAQTGLAMQVRQGYYAPRKLPNAEETAKQEIEEALFSREEISELGVELHTQFFKNSDQDANITVQCRLDPKHIQFRKADGRNSNTLTIVTGVFDRNGKFLSGNVKTLDMKLKDETLTRMLSGGTYSMKTNFSVPPGTYMVRLIVRDTEGQLMSALNGAVTIQ
jgi:VWFA-related protein